MTRSRGIHNRFFCGIGLALVVLSLAFTGCTRSQRQHAAEKAATDYAQKLFKGKEVGVACSTEDTDGDGYISCDLMVDGEVYPVECTYSYIGMTTGCKTRVPTMKMRQP